jgi:exonuclease SbcC
MSEEQATPDPRAAANQARQEAITQAESLAHDEAAAADFVVRCEFADARLKAAHHIHAQPLLEQVMQAMRNADRRVAKLMQQRLDAIHEAEVNQQKAQKCVTEAERLAKEPQLMLNQVADLDRAWQSVGEIAAPLSASFDHLRSILGERLQAQTALQRAVIDIRFRLQQLMQAAADTPQLMPPGQIADALDSMEQEMAQHCAAREAPSLPKQLLSEFMQQQRSVRQALAAMEQRYAAAIAHEQMLADWEAAPLATLTEDDLKRAWRSLPALSVPDAAPFRARLDALIERISQSRRPKESVAVQTRPDSAAPDSQQHFSDALHSMEKALEDGALQVAAEHDKTLRANDAKSIRLSDAQTAQLARARSELSRLQSWARWGGNVSREELLKAAEELPAQAPALAELTKKVGSLRERWKSLDLSAGPASKDLWSRFDAACTVAYAPAAAHFKKLAQERQNNLEKAQALIAEVRNHAAASNPAMADSGSVDWKALASYCTRTIQLWQRLGPIDRKAKKSAQDEFDAAMRMLQEPLAVQQRIEIKRREELIAKATDLDPADRRAADILRELQERWQERAKFLPLERNDEQALWMRFRSACDALFSKRKEVAKGADAERQQHLQAKEALCASLEAVADAPKDAILKALREVREAWSKAGPVPRASERQIDARYQAAITVLQMRLDAEQHAAAAAQASALRAKLAMCRAVEEKLVNRQPPEDSEIARSQASWETLPALSPELERTLLARFDAATSALKTADSQYASLLEQNRPALAQLVLRLEILMGIDSPPELSRERLQLQVDVLQSSLKAGQKPVTPGTQLLQLCELPASTDPQIARRIDQVIGRSQQK